MHLAAHRLELAVPQGWEGRIFRRRTDATGERSQPTVHLANFALPEQRGDFGASVVERMAGSDVFVALFEYGSESAGTPLFAHEGMSRLTPRMFAPSQLQRTLPGQTGCQVFFTASGRAFCCYVVVADRRRLRDVLSQVNRALADLEIEPA